MKVVYYKGNAARIAQELAISNGQVGKSANQLRVRTLTLIYLLERMAGDIRDLWGNACWVQGLICSTFGHANHQGDVEMLCPVSCF